MIRWGAGRGEDACGAVAATVLKNAKVVIAAMVARAVSTRPAAEDAAWVGDG